MTRELPKWVACMHGWEEKKKTNETIEPVNQECCVRQAQSVPTDRFYVTCASKYIFTLVLRLNPAFLYQLYCDRDLESKIFTTFPRSILSVSNIKCNYSMLPILIYLYTNRNTLKLYAIKSVIYFCVEIASYFSVNFHTRDCKTNVFKVEIFN